MLTAAKARALLDYDPHTGMFRWRVDRPCGRGRGGIKVRAGAVAGCKKLDGVSIVIDKKDYRAHRLAWLIMTGAWPVGVVDHRDRDPFNNRWRNLRSATIAQNTRNRGAFRNNTSGAKGVYLEPSGRWRARIMAHGQRHHVGLFDTRAEAASAYRRASRRLHGAFSSENHS